MHALAEDIKRFSPEVTLAQAGGRVDRIFAQLDRAQQTGGQLGQFEATSNDIKNALYRVETQLIKIFGPSINAIAEMLSAITSLLEDIFKEIPSEELGKFLAEFVKLVSNVDVLVFIARWWFNLQKKGAIRAPREGLLRDIINRFGRRFDGGKDPPPVPGMPPSGIPGGIPALPHGPGRTEAGAPLDGGGIIGGEGTAPPPGVFF